MSQNLKPHIHLSKIDVINHNMVFMENNNFWGITSLHMLRWEIKRLRKVFIGEDKE